MNFIRIDTIPFPVASPLEVKGQGELPRAKGVSRPGRDFLLSAGGNGSLAWCQALGAYPALHTPHPAIATHLLLLELVR